MTDVVAALSDLLDHRARVAGELAGLDGDIEKIRRLLGVSTVAASTCEPPPQSVDVQPAQENRAGGRPRAGLRPDLLDPAESVRAAAKRTGVTRKTVRRQRARAAAGETPGRRVSGPTAEERLLEALGRIGPCTRRDAAIAAHVGLWAVVNHLSNLRTAGRVCRSWPGGDVATRREGGGEADGFRTAAEACRQARR